MAKARNTKRWLSTREAVAKANAFGYGRFTTEAIRKWTIRYGLGKKVGGRWRVDSVLLLKFMREGTYDYDKAEGERRL